MTTNTQSTNAHGFTLLEALLALVIVSISLGVLFQVVSSSLQLGFKARNNYVAAAQAQAMFRQVIPQDLEWTDLEWANSTEDFSWTVEIHPVVLQESFEDTGLISGDDLMKIVFFYTDLATEKTFRLTSFRRVDQGSLHFFLQENLEHLVWDEYEQFAEYIAQ